MSGSCSITSPVHILSQSPQLPRHHLSWLATTVARRGKQQSRLAWVSPPRKWVWPTCTPTVCCWFWPRDGSEPHKIIFGNAAPSQNVQLLGSGRLSISLDEPSPKHLFVISLATQHHTPQEGYQSQSVAAQCITGRPIWCSCESSMLCL